MTNLEIDKAYVGGDQVEKIYLGDTEIYSARTGVVTFTSAAGDVAEYTIDQEGTEDQLPTNKIYRNERRIN